MKVAKEIQKIVDQLVYNQLYTPDYPVEDCTDMKKEEKRILAWLDDVLVMIRREDVGDWLRASRASVEKAFESLGNANRENGLREIENSIQYIRNAMTLKPHKVDFVGKPNGSVIVIASSDETRVMD